jgi:hypothetical protein
MLQPRFRQPVLKRITTKGLDKSCGNLFLARCSSTTVSHGQSETTQHATKSRKGAVSEHPLSLMPTNMLLRSLFIATVSSNKLLLLPSLHILSFFAKPNRSLLFNVDRNPILKAILKRTLYNQFCAGETERETRACVRQLKDLGFKGVILTFAKEMVYDDKSKKRNHHTSTSERFHEMEAAIAEDTDIEAWRVGTLKTVDLISEGDILAIK